MSSSRFAHFGVFFLLAACPVLEAAFLEDPVTRILLPIFAYAVIIKGLFWVGMPYLMRDAIDWVTARPQRWRTACSAGALYGLVPFSSAPSPSTRAHEP